MGLGGWRAGNLRGVFWGGEGWERSLLANQPWRWACVTSVGHLFLTLLMGLKGVCGGSRGVSAEGEQFDWWKWVVSAGHLCLALLLSKEGNGVKGG